MTSLLALDGVGTGTRGTVGVPAAPPAAPAPSVSASSTFDAMLAKTRSSAEGIGEKFEASSLTQFVQLMLPADDSEIWGGSAGAMFKGIFAEQLAGQLAKSGGIGIAAMVDQSLANREQTK